MRNRYLVAYDISEQKRLHNVFKTMKGFGEHLQYSVFICDLSYKEKALLISKLNEIIHHREDRVMVVNLGRVGFRADQRIEFLGKQEELPDDQALIV